MDINSLVGMLDNNYELENENNTATQQGPVMNETGEVEKFLNGDCHMEPSTGEVELPELLKTDTGEFLNEISPFNFEKSIPGKYYYNQLPEITRTIFLEKDFAHTEDGFLLCKKSMGDLFRRIAKDIDRWHR